jgi:hypothetical protein
MMSLFELHEGIHQQMDTVRSKFFLGVKGGNSSTTRMLNEALIIKWAWRMYNHKDNDI